MSNDFPEPWWQPDEANRQAVRDELTREATRGHLLAGRPFEVVARCSACDEVLVRLDDETHAIVHPTWSGRREKPPWPTITATGGYLATEAALVAHAVQHG